MKGRLQPFAQGSQPVAECVEYGVSRDAGLLHINYTLHGRITVLVLPESSAENGKRRNELWRTSCFELFLKDRQESSRKYLECNFSPSGDWNIYELSGYRQGLRETSLIKLTSIQTRRTENIFSLDVELDCSVFMSNISQFDIGVSCVIEDTRGSMSYWALSHYGDRPDFHDVRSFELCL